MTRSSPFLSRGKPDLFGGSTLLVCALIVLTLVAIAPVLLVDVPAIPDYPNHLARMHLLSLAGTAHENPYYQVDWTLCPNLAMDIIVPALGRVIGVDAASKAFLILSQILIVTGSAALEWAVQRRVFIAGFAAAACLYSISFAVGLLNFEFGLGLALWALACWVGTEGRPVLLRLLLHAAFVVCIYFAHLLALGIYGIVLGLFMLSRLWERKIAVRAFIGTMAGVAAPALLLLGLAFLIGNGIGSSGTEWRLDAKFMAFLSLCAYRGWASLIDFCVLVLVGWGLFRGKVISILPAGTWIAIGLLILFIVLPVRAGGSAYVDTRIAVGGFLVIPAFIACPDLRSARFYIAPAVLCLIAILNSGVAAAVWLSYQGAFQDLKASFDQIRPGSMILVGSADRPPPQSDYLVGHTFRYAPTLAAPYTRSFVPAVFSDRALYVVHVSQNLRGFEVTDPFQYGPPALTSLQRIRDAESRAEAPAFLRCWPQRYDYLYVVGPPQESFNSPDLTLLVAKAAFSLYKIERDPKVAQAAETGAAAEMKTGQAGCADSR